MDFLIPWRTRNTQRLLRASVQSPFSAIKISPGKTHTAPVADMMNEEHCFTNAINNHNVAPIKPNRFLSTAATDGGGADVAGGPKHTLFEIDSIIGHRLDPKVKTLFQLRVKWKDGDETWEPESAIQEDAEKAFFAYWDGVDGGRLGAMAHKDLWHALKIQSHRQTTSRAVELEVVWVGSQVPSWEPVSKMLEVAAEVVNEYWDFKEECQKYIKDITVPCEAITSCLSSEAGRTDEVAERTQTLKSTKRLIRQ